MGNRASVEAYRKRRASRLDEFKNSENWVTINGVHVLLDKHWNVINNFKDSDHKLKNLRFVDAVSSHTEGGKKVIDAPINRKTHEAKFNDTMKKIASALGGGAIKKDDAQKRMANAFSNLEQGAIINAGDTKALKLGKGLFKLKGLKGNFTAKQLAEKVMGGVKVNDFAGDVDGMPTVKEGTNSNVIQKGSKRISHVATNALEDLYNKYKSNKYSHEGLQKLAKGYLESLPKGSELNVGGNTFKKSDKVWSIEADGEEHTIAGNMVANILLNSMSTGYAGGTLNAKIPEASAATEKKVEKSAEKIAEKKPVKTPKESEPADYPTDEEIKKMAEEFEKETPAPAPKLMSDSLKEIASGSGTPAEKKDAITKFLTELPDGTAISYEATSKTTGELYVVKGIKEGDKIKFTTKEAPLHGVAKSFLKKLEEGLHVGGSDEEAFAWAKSKAPTSEVAKPEEKAEEKPAEKPAAEEKPAEPVKPAKIFATDKMNKLASIPVDKSKYTADKKDTAMKEWTSPSHWENVQKKYKTKSMEWFKGLPEKVRGWFEHYTGGGYTAINNALRNAGSDGLDDYMTNKVNAMTEELAKNKLTEPTILRRGVGYETMASMFGMSYDEVEKLAMTPEKFKDTFLDSVGVDNGFGSCGTAPGTGFMKQFDFEIYCPEGTEAVFANPWSTHKSYTKGSGEFETIVQRGSAYKITGIESKPYGKFKIKCEIVAQRQFVDNFGDAITGKLAA